MKEIIKVKVGKMISFYKKLYIKKNGEMFDSPSENSFATHLIYISNFGNHVYRDNLEEPESKIIDAYFRKNNDHEFNVLITDYMLTTGKEAFNEYNVRDQEVHIFAKLRPIIRAIALTMFLQGGVASILEDEYLNYDEHG